MRLSDAARALDARLVGADAEISSVSTDTRKLPAGCLFVALKGPRFDGHTFAARALEAGAAAVLVEQGANLDVSPALVVDDTRLALGRLAAWHRSTMPARIAAITGSNGKTTVKEMVAAILAEAAGASIRRRAGHLRQPEQRHRHAADAAALLHRPTASPSSRWA
jgi:UDP-N-acetylmuramoyl-tripeptide--D-alanyl-D-alanine ligase